MLLLAEAAPTPEAQFFYNLFLAFGFIASAIASVLAMVRGNRLQRREISMAPGTMPDPEVVELKRRLDQMDEDRSAIRSEMKEDREILETRNEARTAVLHERINQILIAVSEIRGELRQQKRV